ncbi:MAG: glycosyltransferase [Azoarcus sp.]|jgi:glycosyltransferase involved in cell wall biosynthesis|nr:glycosyltransferase [Azoarcus sp.]
MKNILMTAFHFPPQTGSSGILRTLSFVKYLPRHDWQATVLTAHPRAYAEMRDDLLSSIPPDVKVIRAQAFDAARHFSLLGKYPRLFALPDRWGSWWFGATRAGRAEIRRQRPDLIWSTYPISTAHLIGLSLARDSGCPWIADFRDPMINGDYPPDCLQRRVWRAIEARVLAEASACVFTTEHAAQTYRERYPAHAARCRVVSNGYDEAAFAAVSAVRQGMRPDTLLLLHSGIIYPHERDPGPFFAAIRSLLGANVMDRDRLCIRFRAPHHADEVRAAAQAHGLDDVVDVAPPIPYQEALAEMMGADGLLVFQGSAFNAQIPAKIYEYLRAGRPLLALVDPRGNTAKLLSAFEAVSAGNIEDEHDIGQAITAWLDALKSPELPNRLAKNQENVRLYSRAAQAEVFAGICSEIAK